MGCVLCAIAADESHPHVVARHRQTVTILNLHPATEGHLMVLPRSHVADAWSCPVELYRSVYGSVHGAATLLRERLGVDGITIVESVRAAGWQSIAHLHVHVLLVAGLTTCSRSGQRSPGPTKRNWPIFGGG